MVDKYQANKSIASLKRLNTSQVSKLLGTKTNLSALFYKQKRTKIT
jgi:hypothetical protein